MNKYKTVSGFILPALLSPTGIMAAVIVALSLSNALFYKLWQGAVDERANIQATLVMERAQAIADSVQAQADAAKVTLDVSTAWSNALSHLRNSNRIRVLSCSNGNLQNGNAGTSSQVNGAGLKPSISTGTITPEECEVIANNAVMDAAQLTHLQFWINEQR